MADITNKIAATPATLSIVMSILTNMDAPQSSTKASPIYIMQAIATAIGSVTHIRSIVFAGSF